MFQAKSNIHSLFFSCVLFCLSLFTVSLLAQGVHYQEAAHKAEEEKKQLSAAEKKINYTLLQKIKKMTKENAREKAGTEAMIEEYSNDMIQVDRDGRIYVEIYLRRNIPKTMMDRITERIKSVDGKIVNTNYPKAYINWMPEIFAWVPFDKMEEIAGDSLITNIKMVVKPIVRIGDFTTPGDTQLKAQQARSKFGVDGSGVKVGVISNGIDHWLNSSPSGDLPPQITHTNQYSVGDEGTAMLEIVYDIAPGADLYFAGHGTNVSEMESAVASLFENPNSCNIVVDDVGWPDQPYFEDNSLSQTISYYIFSENKTYISACGNDGELAWGGMFRDGGGGWHAWDYDGTWYHTDNKVNVEDGKRLEIYLQWADEWDNAQSDYDLYLVDANGNTIMQGSGVSSQPLETIFYTHSGANTDYYIKVKKVNGPDLELKLITYTRDYSLTLQYIGLHKTLSLVMATHEFRNERPDKPDFIFLSGTVGSESH